MKNPLTFGNLWRKNKKLFWIWLAVAVIAGIAVLAVTYRTMPERNSVTAVINYSFEGIDTGLDPDGNRFSADEIKNDAVILAAAQAAGLEMNEAQKSLVQQHITIAGSLPNNIISQITKHTSIYTDKGVSDYTAAQISSYYPTKYQITFDFAGAGYTREQGHKLLEALLNAYSEYFYGNYGYKAGMEKALLSFDYTAYDYDDAITVLDNRLSVLRGYVDSLISSDKTGFRSEKTGYTFSDLLSAIDTLRSQDVSTLSAYVESNSITQSWREKIDQFNYQIEEKGRERLEVEERIAQIDQLIAAYEKPMTVVMGGGQTTQEGITSAYQITQRSEMLDQLMNDRVELQTELSEIQEQIEWYKLRTTRMRTDSSAEQRTYVTEQMQLIMDKLNKLLADLHTTATEYYENVGLKRAFQVVEAPVNKLTVFRVIRSALADGVAVEALIFGFFLLIAVLRVRESKKQSGLSADTAAMTKQEA